MFRVFLQKNFWELVWTFILRELKIKYAQTYIGIFWMLFPPMMAVVVISFFFGNLMKVSNEIPNYTLFAYCGMMGWYYFSFLVSYTSISLMQNIDLVHKTNIPRIVIPLSKALTGMLDVLVWLSIAIVLKLYFHLPINFSMIFIVFVIALNFFVGFSIGLWIAILSVRWRDIYQIIPYIIGLTMLVTPVLYHLNMVPENLKLFLYLNPVAGVIELYRHLIANTDEQLILFVPGFVLAFIILFVGILVFFKNEKKIAETL